MSLEEGVRESVYSEAANVRPRLLTAGGGATIADALENAITDTNAGRFGYLSVLEAICLVASTTVGTWTLRTDAGGTIVLVLSQPVVASVVGTRYVWNFPVPWKTDSLGGRFTLQQSVATAGTWRWQVNGFHSAT